MAGSTPIYGFPYPEATDLVADYPALGQELAEDIEAALPTVGGLAPATPTSIANSGGSASLSGNTVTFTGVTSVSLNGCFTGDYDNYLLVASGASSGIDSLTLRLRASGSDDSGSNYNHQILTVDGTTITAARQTGQNKATVGYVNANGFTIQTLMFSPFLASATFYKSEACRVESRTNSIGGRHTLTTSYDGFTLFPDAGTFSGTVSVYGYKS